MAIDIVYNIIYRNFKFKPFIEDGNITTVKSQFRISFKFDMNKPEALFNAENKLKPAIEQALEKMLFIAKNKIS